MVSKVMQAQANPGIVSSDAAPNKAARPPLLVWAGIIGAAALFVLAVSLLYYRWATVVEPTSVVMVRGNESIAGAVVTVQGVSLPEPYQLTLDPSRDLEARFFVQPGSYRVRIERPQGGQVVYNESFLILANRSYPIDLTDWQPPVAAQATTQP